jgi:hypothetical protein
MRLIAKSASSFIKKIYDLAPNDDQGTRLSFRTPSENISSYRSILCLYPDCPLWRNWSPSQHQISSKKSASSLPTTIRALGSPLGLHPERDLAINLYSGSTPIARYDESNHRISFKQLQEFYNIAARCNQGMGLSFRNPSENRSRCRSILWLHPGSQLRRDQSTWMTFSGHETLSRSLSKLGTPNAVTQIEGTI